MTSMQAVRLTYSKATMPDLFLGTPYARFRPSSKTPLKLEPPLLLFDLVSGGHRQKFRSEPRKVPPYAMWVLPLESRGIFAKTVDPGWASGWFAKRCPAKGLSVNRSATFAPLEVPHRP